MKYISFLLHAYQPPWQFPEMLKRIIAECYDPMFDFILKNENARFTVNINYSLLEQIEREGYVGLLRKIRMAAEGGRIELTGSGAFHPILPLIPQKEAERQIELNKQGVERILGISHLTGFFPPEMAFSARLTSIVKSNYLWTITEDVPVILEHGYRPYDFISLVNGLQVFLRNSFWSKKIAFKNDNFNGRDIVRWIFENLSRLNREDSAYVILAMDMETFGHHIPGYISFLEQFVNDLRERKEIKLALITELLNLFPLRELRIPPSNWGMEPQQFLKKNYFALWKNRNNPAHLLLWQIVNLALSSLKPDNSETRDLMDRALNSCQFWWLSNGHLNYFFAFQTLPFLLKIIAEDKPENLPAARDIILELEKTTRFQIIQTFKLQI